jgi:hypothetical protein
MVGGIIPALTFADAAQRVPCRIRDALGGVAQGASHAAEDAAACGGKMLAMGRFRYGV